jgi:hypothetical protein
LKPPDEQFDGEDNCAVCAFALKLAQGQIERVAAEILPTIGWFELS